MEAAIIRKAWAVKECTIHGNNALRCGGGICNPGHPVMQKTSITDNPSDNVRNGKAGGCFSIEGLVTVDVDNNIGK